jgi:starvation-inducible DNA-binding protein
VGPSFIGVHEMIDPQVELVRGYADEVAERIAILGFSPQGTPGAILKDRTWDEYSVGRDTVQAHLAALDQCSPSACASTGLLRVTMSGSALVNGKFGRSSMWTLNVAASTSREYALIEAR